MEWQIRVNITLHQVLCWLALVALAWNPEGMFSTLIEGVGFKIPFFMAAGGAGSDFANAVLESWRKRGGDEKP